MLIEKHLILAMKNMSNMLTVYQLGVCEPEREHNTHQCHNQKKCFFKMHVYTAKP